MDEKRTTMTNEERANKASAHSHSTLVVGNDGRANADAAGSGRGNGQEPNAGEAPRHGEHPDRAPSHGGGCFYSQKILENSENARRNWAGRLTWPASTPRDGVIGVDEAAVHEIKGEYPNRFAAESTYRPELGACTPGLRPPLEAPFKGCLITGRHECPLGNIGPVCSSCRGLCQ